MFKLDRLPTDKVVRYKTEPDPLLSQQKQQRENSQNAYFRNNRTPCYERFIIYAPQLVKKEGWDRFFLPLSLGNTARHLSIPWRVEHTRQDREKGGPREYTHTHMGVHKDRGYLKKGNFSNQLGCCLSNKWKIKNGLRKMFTKSVKKSWK
jgi:hypothetical protein